MASELIGKETEIQKSKFQEDMQTLESRTTSSGDFFIKLQSLL